MSYLRPERPASGEAVRRRLPVGAEIVAGGVHFRVWAPAASRATVLTTVGEIELRPEDQGYFSLFVSDLPADATYRFRLDDREPCPDPASRFQPEGPHGPSRVVDPAGFRVDGRRLARRDRARVRCSTRCTSAPSRRRAPGAAAIERLPELAELGITMLELMPVAEFPGASAGATTASICSRRRVSTARPTTCARFVDRGARARPRRHPRRRLQPPRPGRQLPRRVLARLLHATGYTTEWGEALNFDGPGCGPVREFFVANAALLDRRVPPRRPAPRRDAGTSSTTPRPRAHPGRDAREAARGGRPPRRSCIVGENEPQHARLVRAPRGRWLWASTRSGTTTSTTPPGWR